MVAAPTADTGTLDEWNFEGMGMGMGIHGKWQTCNDSLTIRECHSPNGNANGHLWEKTYQFLE